MSRKKESCNEVTKFAESVNGEILGDVVADVNVAEIWKIHFSDLCLCVDSLRDRVLFQDRIDSGK